MDPNFPEASNFIKGYYHFDEEGNIVVSESDPIQYDNFLDADPNQYDGFLDAGSNQYDGFLDADPLDFSVNTVPMQGSSSASVTDPSLEDTDFSDTIKFISQILMEEDVDRRPFYDPVLQITEKSFNDALLHENKPLSPNQHPLDIHSSDGSTSTGTGTSTSTSNSNSNSSIDEFRESKPLSPETPVSDLSNNVFQFSSPAISHSLSRPNTTSVSNGLRDLDSSITNMLAQNIFSDADSVSLFRKGLEEANKFLPPQPKLVTGLESSNFNMFREKENLFVFKGRKNHEREESDDKEEEEARRSNKQSAISVVDEDELSEMFDKVLLSMEHFPLCNENDSVQNGQVKTEQSPPSNGGKARTKKQSKKNETIDLRNLLLLCSQSVYANDNRNANELLKQIRQHSSPSGDAPQRLAHYFANGLEARLLGNGTSAETFFFSASSKSISTSEYLKAYQVHLSTSPFKKFAYFFAIKAITEAAANAETLHIIDFGILYGFQWPILIKFLSDTKGGPPKLKITGIEFPLPGFRPMERIEETGRRLANYCKRFNVPFEFNAIASRNWETIRVEDLKIKSNEVVVVNSLMRFKNLLDETIEANSPRDAVLHLIRKINPVIFAQSIVNGSYNSPFFATRFREALFHFSAIYDNYDTVIPRENKYRMMMEKESVGREVMNVVACEGLERVERPETYKQWQARNTRAGFKQLPLDPKLMDKFRTKLRKWYHKDFVFDEDNNWMLQGWKGRILYASTCWVPA
ncbi:scarecrow-like protein 34 [Vicia villosa]|uniref:scarecrow-like protein 34 n=1 Tax=Vicia villosa TaxID=3911 RepID=UPI00273B9084|nr:scarecrow-like protein 34 [Vicia villosa]